MSTPATPVVWITGAAGGLGCCLVDEFLAAGARVVASTHQTPLTREHPNLITFPLDVTVRTEVANVVESVVERWGRLDVLVNNAGVTQDRLITQMSEAQWDQVMDTNLRAAFLCAQAVIPLFLKQSSGHIVNISSFAARRGHAGQANYVASKAGLIGLTQSLAQELGASNIQVNAVLPGVLPTRMTEHLTEDQLRSMAEANALNRLNDATEVARFVAFLTTLRNVSGQIFQLDSRVSRWT